MMTGFVVLMISFMASSITTMRQIKPIREMAAATRQYADGDFDVRMNDYGREDEIGELAASFNNMAECLAADGASAPGVHRQHLPRAENPHDHHRRVYGRHFGRYHPA